MKRVFMLAFAAAIVLCCIVEVDALPIGGRVTVLPNTWDTQWLSQSTGTIRCYIGELSGGVLVSDIDPATIRLNSTLPIFGGTFRLRASMSGFIGQVLECAFDRPKAFDALGWVVPGNSYSVFISGRLKNGQTFLSSCQVSIIGTPLVDNTPPSIVISGVADGVCTKDDVTPAISISDRYLVSSSILLDGAAYVSGTAVTTEGSHVLRVDATDKAGNASSKEVSFVIDKTPPIVSSSLINGQVSTSPLPLIVECLDDQPTVTSITIDGQPSQSGALITEIGVHAIRITCQDCAGNTTVRELTVTITGQQTSDNAIPGIFIVTPQNNSKTNNASPEITIKYQDQESGINRSSFTATLNGVQIGSQFVLNDAAGTYQPAQPLTNGMYNLVVSVADNAGNTNSATCQFEVDNARPVETALTGSIEGYVYDTHAETPLEGAIITGRDSQLNVIPGRILTDVTGHFSYPTPSAGVFYIDINKPGYTYAQRKATVETDRPIGIDHVYLLPLDPVVTTITPSGGTHTDSKAHVQIDFPSGAVNYPINVSVTEIDSVVQLPAPLPDSSVFTFCFELEPHGQVFNVPLTIRVKNYLGFSVGDSIPVGFFSPEQGKWEHLAMAYVQPGGEWIQYQANRFSWQDCNASSPPPLDPPVEPVDNEEYTYLSESIDNSRTDGECGSKYGFQSGDLSVFLSLPAVKSRERWDRVSFTYNSGSAKPSFLVDFDANLGLGRAKATTMKLNFGGSVEEKVFDWQPIVARFAEEREAKDYLGNWLTSGRYPYELSIANMYDSLVYWSSPCFGCGRVNPTMVNVRQFSPSPLVKIGTAVVDNKRESPFGGGWWLDGLYKIDGRPGDDVVTLIGGSMMIQMDFCDEFLVRDSSSIIDCDTMGCRPGWQYTTRDTVICDPFRYSSAGYDFHLDVQSVNGTNIFTLNLLDGTIIEFDANGLMVRKTIRNHEIFLHSYNSNELLTSITDPFGRVTTFAYDNSNHLKSVADQVGRTTRFNISPANELLQAIFPDNTLRSFVYDDLLMTREIDANGASTDFAYHNNRLHQIIGTTCCHGTLITLEPSSSKGLVNDLPPGFGTESQPATLVPAAEIYDVRIGAVNDTTLMRTNKFGQVVYERNALGYVTTYKYNDLGRVTKVVKPNRAIDLFEYDSAGQLTRHIDPLGAVTSLSYTYENLFGMPRLIRTQDPRGNIQVNSYDSLGQLTMTLNALPDTTRFVYDSLGMLARTFNAIGDSNYFRYDSLLNISVSINATGDSIVVVNDLVGNMVSTVDQDGFVKQYQYDVMNRMLTYTDQANQATKYTHDANGNTLTVTDAKGNTTGYEYDGRNRLTASVDALGNRTSYSYDNAGNMNSKTTPNGESIAFTYDQLGQLLKKSFAQDSVFYRYDNVGNVVAVLNSASDLSFRYGLRNEVDLDMVDSLYATKRSYDLSGNIVQKQLTELVGDTAIWSTTYVSCLAGPGPVKVMSADFNQDGLNDIMSWGQTIGSAYIQTNLGDLLFDQPLQLPYFSRPIFAISGNFNDDQYPDLAVVGAYSGGLQVGILTNNEGQFTTSAQFLAGLGGTGIDTADVDGDGDLDLVTGSSDGNSIRILLNDGHGFFSASPISYPLGMAAYSIICDDYDQDGDIDIAVRQTFRVSLLLNDGTGGFSSPIVIYSTTYPVSLSDIGRGDFDNDGLADLAVSIYSYNGSSVRILRNLGAGNFTLSWQVGSSFYGGAQIAVCDFDRDGYADLARMAQGEITVFMNLKNGTFGGKALSVPGDALISYVTQSVLNNDHLSDIIVVDNRGNRLLFWPLQRQPLLKAFETIGYSYDSTDRLTDLTAVNVVTPDSLHFSMLYDRLGLLTSMSALNGPTTSRAYDPQSRLTRLENSFRGGSVSSFEYGYDRRGNRTSITDNLGVHQYQYDALSQLVSANHSQPVLPNETYSYDASGNRASSHLSQNYVVDAGNRLLEDDQYTYSYDRNGNMNSKTSKSNGNHEDYDFDAENKLIGYRKTQGGVVTDSAFYKYDGLGNRIAKIVNGLVIRYVYDREDIVMELDSTNIIRAYYVHGPGIDNPLAMIRDSSVYYYMKDGLGSVVQVVDSAGNSKLQYSYDSYGNIKQKTGGLSNPYSYTAREYDAEIGLFYYRARYYMASTGRFLSPDPIMHINPYIYAENNPIRLVDPFGLDACEPGLLSKAWTYTKEFFWNLVDGLAPSLLDPIQTTEDAVILAENAPVIAQRLVDNYIDWGDIFGQWGKDNPYFPPLGLSKSKDQLGLPKDFTGYYDMDGDGSDDVFYYQPTGRFTPIK